MLVFVPVPVCDLQKREAKLIVLYYISVNTRCTKGDRDIDFSSTLWVRVEAN